MNGHNKIKRVELLAPAGSMRALEAVLRAGADAVYLSGKQFGMRGHRSSFHFDDYAMKKAILKAHEKGRKIYVTVNNLLSDSELDQALGYIAFLKEYGADAVILQDLGLLRRLKMDPPGLDLHVSTMMNVHSSSFAACLQSLGVTRIIASRDVTLAQVAAMAKRTNVEMEYFIHGDMCSVQSGLCLLSGVLFGQSSNRGRCLKPCRWPWKILKEGMENDAVPLKYLMARKDMCLLHALPAMLDSGITSLKIEGRMKPADFLEQVVGVYRRAIDRYCNDPMLYEEDPNDAKLLSRERVRDFTTSHAFGRPGPASMGFSGKREPKFFSHPVHAPSLVSETVKADPILGKLPEKPPEVCAALFDPLLLEPVLAEDPDWIYWMPHFRVKDRSLTLRELSLALKECRRQKVKCAMVLPPVTPDQESDHLPNFFEALDPGPDAWMAGNLGQVSLLKPLLKDGRATLMADSSFNLFNRSAIDLLANEGVSRIALSPEVSFNHMKAMNRPFPAEIEWTVHGPVQVMFTEDCLLRIAMDKEFDPGTCRRFCEKGPFVLKNEIGDSHPILSTRRCRNAVFSSKHLCLLHRMGSLLRAGASCLRLNLFGYEGEDAAKIVRIYKKSLERIFTGDKNGYQREDLKELAGLSSQGLWEGAADYGVVPH